jgi:hypothetical protein
LLRVPPAKVRSTIFLIFLLKFAPGLGHLSHEWGAPVNLCSG